MNKQWWLEPCRVPDEAARQAARQRDARLTKPAGSLGRIEP
ncbi:MAG TPA: nicotinate-nucleotide--dimethylbenzimidazole phosphoribosyltransferase, partial [Pseudomonas sp.]|nr:nicotinate-nucleotide--dimethylbenzimidazole phosphoribosyltransferase [Pseudomonas sp.]